MWKQLPFSAVLTPVKRPTRVGQSQMDELQNVIQNRRWLHIGKCKQVFLVIFSFELNKNHLTNCSFLLLKVHLKNNIIGWGYQAGA